MPLLTVENLKLGYEGKTVAEQLSFQVNRGDYLCIVGENGSGKTTLMKAVLHLKAPISGKIIAGDGLKPSEIGYLPQQTDIQRDFPASVFEIVLSGNAGKSGLRPFYTKKEKAEATEALEKMGIEKLARRSYRELSGGQQQRVLLARAICAASEMLLLDEPVSALDPIAASEMYELIEKLNGDGMTVVMISHDINAAVKYSTHILSLGNDVFFGTTEEYLKAYSVTFVEEKS